MNQDTRINRRRSEWNLEPGGHPLAKTERPIAIVPEEALGSVFIPRAMLHPTVYRKRITRIEGSPKAGDWVSVYSTEGSATPQLFGYGLYNDRAEIAVRMMRWWGNPPDDAFIDDLLDRAISLRCEWLSLDKSTDAYRLIHAEADGFPGLVVDRYADTLSAEVFSLGMFQRSRSIIERLAAKLGTKHWLIQPSPMFLSQEGYDATSFSSEGLPASVVVQEWGTKFRVQFESSHKTGFFCDQRENRLKLAELCEGKSVLDLCCYTGGFSVQAAKLGKAAEVIGVDLDEDPLKVAKKNADLNQVRIKFAQSDAFAYMRDMQRLGRKFDIVVLDPPKLIRSRNEYEEGAKKHFDLNRLAMQLVRPGGFLLTCSCAGLLPDHEFLQIIRSAAKATGYDADGQPCPPRSAQIVWRHGAAADHPVLAHCPETDYLKSLWVRLW